MTTTTRPARVWPEGESPLELAERHPSLALIREATEVAFVDYARDIVKDDGYTGATTDPDLLGTCLAMVSITRKYALMDDVESPIEALFVEGVAMHLAWKPFGLQAQVQIGQYRVDFLMTDERHDRKVVVECDGHDFHERTKDQAKRDRSRDRWLMRRGYTVARFTGSEIWANPVTCAQEALDLLYGGEDW